MGARSCLIQFLSFLLSVEFVGPQNGITVSSLSLVLTPSKFGPISNEMSLFVSCVNKVIWVANLETLNSTAKYCHLPVQFPNILRHYEYFLDLRQTRKRGIQKIKPICQNPYLFNVFHQFSLQWVRLVWKSSNPSPKIKEELDEEKGMINQTIWEASQSRTVQKLKKLLKVSDITCLDMSLKSIVLFWYIKSPLLSQGSQLFGRRIRVA